MLGSVNTDDRGKMPPPPENGMKLFRIIAIVNLISKRLVQISDQIIRIFNAD
jgi:hypothetical protein